MFYGRLAAKTHSKRSLLPSFLVEKVSLIIEAVNCDCISQVVERDRVTRRPAYDDDSTLTKRDMRLLLPL